jgi:hypothetical protein
LASLSLLQRLRRLQQMDLPRQPIQHQRLKAMPQQPSQ